jgi:hypothetical protein
VESLEVIGDAPHLTGLRCDAILCVEYWHAGRLVEASTTAHLCFDGGWHRLYFDYGIVLWRPSERAPQSFDVPELSASYRVADVAATRGLLGYRLSYYEMQPIEGGSRVTFTFENGHRLTFDNVDDITSYQDA